MAPHHHLCVFDQVLTSKEEDAPVSRTEQAKRLLKQYGSAYLITSISFAIVSFAACYAAVSAGEREGRGGGEAGSGEALAGACPHGSWVVHAYVCGLGGS